MISDAQIKKKIKKRCNCNTYYFYWRGEKISCKSISEGVIKYKELLTDVRVLASKKQERILKTELGVALKSWVEGNYKRECKKDSTYARNLRTLNNQILPFDISHLQVRLLTYDDLYDHLFLLYKKGYSQSVLKKVYHLIKSFYDDEFREDYRMFEDGSPFRKGFKSFNFNFTTKHIESYNVEELIKICNTALEVKDFWLPEIIPILANTGLRIGELLALEVKDINFTEKYINVSKTLIETQDRETGKNVRRTEAPKTATSQRFIPMNSDVEKLFKIVLLKTDSIREEFKTEFVFVTQNGKTMTSNSIRRKFESILKIAGFSEVIDEWGNPKIYSLHSLRRSFASYLDSRDDVKEKTTQEILGHSSFETTKKHYIKKDMEELLRAVN